MTWKTVANQHFGSPHIYGGDDIDKISKLFSGTEDVDTVDINTNWPIRDDKFKLRNPANTASYIYSTSAIPSDITITEPVMSFTSDKPVYENATQTLNNKTLSNSPFPADMTVLNPEALDALEGDPTIRRWGTYYPAPTGSTPSTVGKFDGILSGYTASADTAGITWSGSHNSLGARLTTAASTGDTAGLQPPTTMGTFRLRKAGRFKVKFIGEPNTGFSTNFFGLVEWATPPAGVFSEFGTGIEGFLVRSNNDQWEVNRNDGSLAGSSGMYTSLSGQSITFPTVVEISWPGDTEEITISITNGTPATFTDFLPDIDTNLYFHAYVRNHNAVVRNIFLHSVYIESE